MDVLHPEIARYLEDLPAEVADYEPSLFWERLLAGRESINDLLTDVVVEAPAERPVRDDPWFRQANRVADEADTLARAMGQLQADSGKLLWEHAQGVGFLRRQGVTADYVEFLDRHGLRSSMPMARFFWHSRMVGSLIKEHVSEPVRVVEIGAGPAWMAVALNDLVDVGSYTSVELPQNIVQGAYVTARWLPDKPLHVGELGDGWSFVPPRLIHEIPDGSVDVVGNMSSFMEMDEAARDGYIAEAYRIGRPGALFFNVNRRQRALPQRDGSVFDNNPLLYPYRDTDRVLLWEEDWCQQAVRTAHQAVPTLAIVRAALL
jgi:hypothetical protein